ncbi:unnamed protein product [Rhodiola kirilowii]
MSMVGEMNYFLGLQVIQKDDGIFISQSKYAKNLIKKFDLEKASHKRTPAATHLKITKDDDGTKVDQTMYRSMIGSLLYLTASRPDIAYAIGVCARYQADPKESHLLQVKRVIKYVCGTVDFGSGTPRTPTHTWLATATLTGQETLKIRRARLEVVSSWGTTWSHGSAKSNSISLSTAEAEYIAAGSCCTQLLWMKQMLSEYGVEQKEMTFYCDNMSAISISKNPVQHSKTKHIDIRHHFIRELVEQKVVILKHVTTDKQLADIFTKPLDAAQFETLRSSLGLCVVKN